jgi:hypothetical protein
MAKAYAMVSVEHEFYVDDIIDQIDTDVLVEELEGRGMTLAEETCNKEDLLAMYEKYTSGQPIDAELKSWFYHILGRIA